MKADQLGNRGSDPRVIEEDNPGDSRTPPPEPVDDSWIRHVPSAVSVPVAAGARWRVSFLPSFLPSLVWLVPVVVILGGGWLTVRAAGERGSIVTITFATADGLEANKTTVRYKGVAVGSVKAIALRDDGPGVVATVELSRQMSPLLVEDAKFWVVRPRVSAVGISGMNTLFGGAQIAFDRGSSSKKCRAFASLETEPVTSSDRRGTRINLRSENPGSLDVGSPVYFRSVQVGRVTRLALESSGDAVLLEAFIDAPYDSRINASTRFWNASGLNVTLGVRGLRVDTQSVASILAGGLAFENRDPAPAVEATPVPTLGTFPIFASREAALRGSISRSNDYRLSFNRSIRGLEVGARVELLGLEVGEVREVEVELDAETAAPRTRVVINLDPELLHLVRAGDPELPSTAAGRASAADDMLRVLAPLVERGGLRARVRIANFLTNQRYVALEREPDAGAAEVDWTARPVSLPTSRAIDQELGDEVERLVSNLASLPLGRLTTEATSTLTVMRRTLEDVSSLTNQVDGDLVPHLQTAMTQSERTLGVVERTLASDSPLQRDLQGSLRELTAAAQSIRLLAETLKEHPESLVWGRRKGARK
jgi:paraquat-inducible protein B